MDTATGIFLLAVGAILKFAINASIQGINLDVVGVILMLAGGVIILFGLFFEARWADRGRRGDRVVVEERVDPRV
jgi:hypothetical protein